jgi:hypothetical protein
MLFGSVQPSPQIEDANKMCYMYRNMISINNKDHALIKDVANEIKVFRRNRDKLIKELKKLAKEQVSYITLMLNYGSNTVNIVRDGTDLVEVQETLDLLMDENYEKLTEKYKANYSTTSLDHLMDDVVLNLKINDSVKPLGIRTQNVCKCSNKECSNTIVINNEDRLRKKPHYKQIISDKSDLEKYSKSFRTTSSEEDVLNWLVPNKGSITMPSDVEDKLKQLLDDDVVRYKSQQSLKTLKTKFDEKLQECINDCSTHEYAPKMPWLIPPLC